MQNFLNKIQDGIDRENWNDYIIAQETFPKGDLAYELPSRLARVQEASYVSRGFCWNCLLKLGDYIPQVIRVCYVNGVTALANRIMASCSR